MMKPSIVASSRGASAYSSDSTVPQYVDVPLIDVDDVMIQGELFPLEEIQATLRGYRGSVASTVAGITYRQLDYWARKRIVIPSIAPSSGSGSRRLYSVKDIVILAVSKRLLDIGVNLQNVTNAIAYLMEQPVERLPEITIICNGHDVQECADGTQITQMLQRGEAVFGVAVGSLWHHIYAALEQQEYIDVVGEMKTSSPGIPKATVVTNTQHNIEACRAQYELQFDDIERM